MEYQSVGYQSVGYVICVHYVKLVKCYCDGCACVLCKIEEVLAMCNDYDIGSFNFVQ